MVGCITTLSGEQVKEVGELDTESIKELTNAFAETDQLLYSLKLGSAHRIVVAGSGTNNSVVQTKVSGQSGSLMTTAIGSDLNEAFVNSSILNEMTQQALTAATNSTDQSN